MHLTWRIVWLFLIIIENSLHSITDKDRIPKILRYMHIFLSQTLKPTGKWYSSFEYISIWLQSDPILFYCCYTRIKRNPVWGYLPANFFFTNKMVGFIPQLCVPEVMPIQFLTSLRASNINFCSGLSLLIPKDSRTCANSLLYYSIFVCNPKILFLTLSLIG